MLFDLTDLRLFLNVTETGSITAGASKSCIALASASARIAKMEASFGASLLERGRRGVRLTPAGRILSKHAALILGQAQQLRGELQPYGAGLRGEVRVLANTSAVSTILADFLPGFLQAHPDLDLVIEEFPSSEIATALMEARAAVGILADTANTAGLQSTCLTQDRLVLVAPAGHWSGAKRQVSFLELLDERFVGLAGGALEAHLTEQAARLGRRLEHRVRVRSFDAQIGLIGAGVGIGVLPAAIVRRAHTHAARVCVTPLSDSWADRRLLLCARDFGELPAPARPLVSELQSWALSNRSLGD